MRCGCETHGEPITLTSAQVDLAVRVGVRRQFYHLDHPKGKNPLRPEPPRDEGMRIQIQGAGGEIAAGLAVGIPARLSVEFTERHLGDLEDGTEVRTRPEHHHQLGLHKWDANDRRWMLIVGQLPTYWVIGWILGSDGKRDEWYSQGKNGWASTWWVPHAALSKEFGNDRGAISSNDVYQLRLPICD